MTTLTKSDIALIDELINSRKNAIDSQSKLIVQHCIAYQNNQPCNQTLIKNALKLFRADKKIKAYQSKIDKAEKRQSTQQRREITRKKFLVGHAFSSIIDDEMMIKMIACYLSSNQKDKDFLLENCTEKQISEIATELIYTVNDDEYHQLTVTKYAQKWFEFKYIHVAYDDVVSTKTLTAR